MPVAVGFLTYIPMKQLQRASAMFIVQIAGNKIYKKKYLVA